MGVRCKADPHLAAPPVQVGEVQKVWALNVGGEERKVILLVSDSEMPKLMTVPPKMVARRWEQLWPRHLPEERFPVRWRHRLKLRQPICLQLRNRWNPHR